MTPDAVSSRVETLSREQLIAEIERLERFRADFLVLLAHEIRDPLWPMMNVADLFDRQVEDAEARERLKGVLGRQIERLRQLADGLLDVARVTYGRIPLLLERLDLVRLVREVTSERTVELTLSIDAPETPVWVRGDTTRLRQVVQHLIENACTFTGPDGKVAVRIDLDQKTKQVTLRVRDTGMGIEPSMLGNVFEPFSQPDRSLDRCRGGLGLGLALVKGLVNLHGGTIEAWSAGRDEGSEFTVRLNFVAEAPVLESVPTRPPSVMDSCRVLVIEDNRDGSDTLRKVLEMAGHEVRVAYTGPEGVEMGVDWRPDVVLCDIGLPGLNGLAVADEFRRRSVASTARLIAITGYGTKEDIERSKEHGFEAHLTKPANPVELLMLVTPRPRTSASDQTPIVRRPHRE